MSAFLYETAGFVVASLPFLPRGKGSLILLAGGLCVLAASLLWSMIVSRPGPLAERFRALGPAQRRAAVAPTRAWAARPPTRAGRAAVFSARDGWVDALVREARPRVGPARVLRGGADGCVLLVEHCPDCKGANRPGPCETARLAFEAAARRFDPFASVVQVSRSSPWRAGCAFAVRLGG